jgi:hypothetical protein
MDVFHSDRPAKRFVVVLDGGAVGSQATPGTRRVPSGSAASRRTFYFGSPTGFTFIDGASEKTRGNYRKRHYANQVERHRIDNLIPSPALFSWYLLWNTPDLGENIRILEMLLKRR